MNLVGRRNLILLCALAVGALSILCACTSSHGGSTAASGAAASSVGSSSGAVASSPAATGAASSASSSSATSTRTSGKPKPSRHSGSSTSSGSLTTVAPIKVKTKSPVPFKSTAHYGSGVTAKVVHITHGTEKDTGPGVLTGKPTITFTLSLHNGSSKSVSLNTVQVTAVYGQSKDPASPANQSSTKPFSGTVAPGKSQSATYSFAIPTSDQNRVTVYIWYKEHEPTVAFSGDAS